MIAIKIVYNCLNEDNCSAVCMRNHQIDLRKSVFREIKRACHRLGLVEGNETDFETLERAGRRF